MVDFEKLLGIDLAGEVKVEDLAQARPEPVDEKPKKALICWREAIKGMENNYWLIMVSRFTRQRRRAEVRNLLLGLNAFPANRDPRPRRRKNALANVNPYMKANPVQYEEGR